MSFVQVNTHTSFVPTHAHTELHTSFVQAAVFIVLVHASYPFYTSSLLQVEGPCPEY